jgi:hypothetical protein
LGSYSSSRGDRGGWIIGFVFGAGRPDEVLSLLNRIHLEERARLEGMKPIPGGAKSDRARRAVRMYSMARLLGKAIF